MPIAARKWAAEDRAFLRRPGACGTRWGVRFEVATDERSRRIFNGSDEYGWFRKRLLATATPRAGTRAAERICEKLESDNLSSTQCHRGLPWV